MIGEAPNEKHNRLAREIVAKIWSEYPNSKPELRLVILESLIFGFISTLTKSHEDRLKLLDIVFEGVCDRLKGHTQ